MELTSPSTQAESSSKVLFRKCPGSRFFLGHHSSLISAYIVSKANKNVISCTIGSDGKFTSCVENPLTGVSVDSLNRIALQGSYAYITNNAQAASTGSVIKCEIGAGGKLNNCAAIPGLSFDSGLIDADSNGSDIRFLFTASQQ